jgi:hypothetical protein
MRQFLKTNTYLQATSCVDWPGFNFTLWSQNMNQDGWDTAVLGHPILLEASESGARTRNCRKMQKTTPECTPTVCSWSCCSVSVDLYQFKATAGKDAKLGKIFQTTHMGRFAHDAANGITLRGDNKGSECKFWIYDLNNQGELQETIRRSLRLKHYAILKPILCNESEELSKCIAACACAVYQETFVEWRRTQQVKSSGDYLSDEEKSMIM